MLSKYNIHNSIPFSFKFTTDHSKVVTLADNIWKKLIIDKTKKIHLKKECLIFTILNLRLGWLTCNYIRYSRKKEYYAKYPLRYKRDFYTYDIMCQVISGLEKLNYIKSELGFTNPEDGCAQLTKIRATNNLIKEIRGVKNDMIQYIAPPELVILKERGKKGSKLNYTDTANIKQIRRELIEYNTLRQSTNFSLQSLTDITLTSKQIKFLKQFGLNSSNSKELPLSNPFIYRVFSGTFNQGGRYYNGVESKMPKKLRKKILINNQPTVEKDFSCLHINMLYNQKGIRLRGDAYSRLSENDSNLRKIYKQIGLISINAASLKQAINGFRFRLIKKGLNKILPDLTNNTLMPFFENWKKCHKKISEYFFTDIGIRLQYLESIIATRVINYFTKKSIPVLVIHDSFIINENHGDELERLMIKEYKKLFNYTINVN